MKIYKLNFRFVSAIGLLLIISFFTSCEKQNIEPNANRTFGIRHDKALVDYEMVASNTSPFNTTNYPDFSSVVNFTYSVNGSSEYDYVATGVLVKSNWILTAGHNFFVSDEQSSPAPTSGIIVNVGNDPNNPNQTYTVAELVFHPTWLDQDLLFESANDLCLVRLSSSITNITPSPIYTSSSEPLASTIWFCGYGDYSSLAGQTQGDYSKKHAIENTLDRIVSGVVSTNQAGDSYTGGLLAFDFDSPDGTVNSLGDDYISPDEPLLGTGTSSSNALDFEGATVQGDSGGPIFCKINNQWQVVGILSGGANAPIKGHKDGSYGDISFFTRVSSHYSWIESVIE